MFFAVEKANHNLITIDIRYNFHRKGFFAAVIPGKQNTLILPRKTEDIKPLALSKFDEVNYKLAREYSKSI